MPDTTRQIKQRIKTAGNISKITKAMEMVSASKMRRAQDQALATRPYTTALQESLATLAAATDQALHPLLEKHDQGVDVAVLISTDKGLCGSLNPNLFKAVVGWTEKRPNAKVIAVGKKAVSFAQLAGLNLHAQFVELPERISPGDILPITSLVSDGFLEREFKSVSVIYMDFVSTLVQKVAIQQVLPLPEISEDDIALAKLSGTDYLFEPSAKEILNHLLPYYLENAIFQAFLEARASEHSARMVSMKNASENAKELMSELRLEYNKSRQTAVTSELLDITTARLAQA